MNQNRGRVVPVQLAAYRPPHVAVRGDAQWYKTVLGVEVVHSDGVLAFLSYDAEHHRIAIAQIPGLEEQPAMTAGTDHVAFTYADLGDLL